MKKVYIKPAIKETTLMLKHYLCDASTSVTTEKEIEGQGTVGEGGGGMSRELDLVNRPWFDDEE